MVKVRYIVDDVDAAIPFYENLGFEPRAGDHSEGTRAWEKFAKSCFIPP